MMRRPDPGDHRVDEGSEYPRKNDENSNIESAEDETCAVDVETDSAGDDSSGKVQYIVVPIPEFFNIKAEVEKLRVEISMLLLERDELQYIICRNIETAYLLAFGALEHRAFELHCEVLRLKRKLELIRARKNRQEKIDLNAIDEILNEEFLEFQHRLNEQIDRMNEALDYRRRRALPEDEVKEIKRLYRNIVKALHPDLHPNVTPEEIRLFHNAVRAYEEGDLAALRIIAEIVAEPACPEHSMEALSSLKTEKERLGAALSSVREQIAKIKSDFPYTMKDLVNDPNRIAEKRSELENTIKDLTVAYDYYAVRIEDLLK